MAPENYYALLVSILANVPPDEAFELLESGKRPKRIGANVIDINEMKRLKHKKKMTYQQIGDLYGVSKFTVYNRIRRFDMTACEVKTQRREAK